MTGTCPAPTIESLAGGGHVAYRFLPGRAPTAAFLCGYASDMSGTEDLARLARTLRGVLR